MILDRYKLTPDNPYAQETFEMIIRSGASIKDILICFGVTYSELGDWVKENYNGASVETIYDRIRMVTFEEYKDALVLLAARGNSSAITTVNQYVHNLGEQERNMKIEIINNVPDLGNGGEKK